MEENRRLKNKTEGRPQRGKELQTGGAATNEESSAGGNVYNIVIPSIGDVGGCFRYTLKRDTQWLLLLAAQPYRLGRWDD